MSTQLAEARSAGFTVNAAPIKETAAVAPPSFNEILDDGRPVLPARGVIIGILISSPFWFLVGLTIYLLR